jgi:23S rRNA (adenine2503-C2)-methyltransferase
MIWQSILSTKRDGPTARLAWRLMRQFASEREIEQEFGVRPEWHWGVAQAPSSSSRQAVRLLLANREGVRCETVVLFPTGPQPRSAVSRWPRATACVSSQPGCGVGCPFCATAGLGYRGNLSAEEIVEQVYHAGHIAHRRQCRLRNVVYMGMGEPLHNLEAVAASLRILTAEAGFGLSPQRITVSTTGVPTAMVDLARQFPRLRLALSLHSAEPSLRRRLVPKGISDMRVLREMIADVNSCQTHAVWLEVVLLRGINDSLDDARRLVQFCERLRVEVNLMAYNATGGAHEFRSTHRSGREAFAGVLREAGIRTTIRTSLGAENNAACGQLTAPLVEAHFPRSDRFG